MPIQKTGQEMVADWKKCRFCEKVFNKTSDRVRHERVHTGEKPYICNVCNKGFRQKAHLLGHCMRLHNATDEELGAVSKTYLKFGP